MFSIDLYGFLQAPCEKVKYISQFIQKDATCQKLRKKRHFIAGVGQGLQK